MSNRPKSVFFSNIDVVYNNPKCAFITIHKSYESGMHLIARPIK